MNRQKVEVIIMDQQYGMTVPEADIPTFEQAVAQVNQAMCRIRDAGKVKVRERIAVLAALNIAFDAEQAAQVALAAPSNTGTDADTAASSPASQAADQQRLQTLIAQLDAALGQDGQLL